MRLDRVFNLMIIFGIVDKWNQNERLSFLLKHRLRVHSYYCYCRRRFISLVIISSRYSIETNGPPHCRPQFRGTYPGREVNGSICHFAFTTHA